MDALVEFIRANPVVAVFIAGAVAVGLYLLLNMESAASKDARRRVNQLREQNRDRYRELRPPK